MLFGQSQLQKHQNDVMLYVFLTFFKVKNSTNESHFFIANFEHVFVSPVHDKIHKTT